MLNKYLIVGFNIIFSVSVVIGQAPIEKDWDYRFGGTEYDNLDGVLELPSGEIFLYGTSSSDAEGDKSQDAYETWPGINSGDVWVLKLDAFGEKIWDYRYGGTNADAAYDCVLLADGSIMLAGISSSPVSGEKSQPSWGYYDYWMIKIDADGNYLWDKRFGTTASENLTCIVQTQDGGFVLGGYTEGDNNGDKTQPAWEDGSYEYDYWIVKTDAVGNKLWDKRYGGLEADLMHGIVELPDGSLMLGGYSYSGVSGDKTTNQEGLGDYWVVKTDAEGNYIWDKKYGGNLEEKVYHMILDNDNNIIIGGNSRSDISGDKTEPAYLHPWYGNSTDYWIVKIDLDGNKIWDHRYGGEDFEDEFGNIFQTSDNGYLLSGNSYSWPSGEKTEENLGEEQMWSLLIDNNGTVLWDKTIFTDSHEELGLGIQLQDGCYLFATYSYAPVSGYKTQSPYAFLKDDYWITKFCDTTAILPIANFTNELDTICQTSCLNFNYTGSGASSFLWEFEGGTPNVATTANPVICYENAGNFNVTLIVTNDAGADTITMENIITVLPSPAEINLPETAILCNYESLVLTVGSETATWSTGETGSEITIFEPGLFSVTDSGYCGAVIDSVLVIAQQCNCELLKPNAFSPNNDGANDVFRLIAACDIDFTYLHIYNRWGEKVFETTNIETAWNGTFKNENQPMGTYVYVVSYINENGNQVEEGNITLLR
ncbi:MAG TPA: gliding motility-associated C-terminal domain-containing protein [Chitinophagales bacterium]|nr:gliding motility-associated C-terminal domain-containing protein [Chitinophagales bacterium]HRG26612.1 gliding motility-associated C-terminal domain-containing protein [Chitinophagales bacterium]HRG84996.1 gliding motility-associated C-terminal domain-containing protein [Chitinophagales bacterium]HRH52287.1 gliding motility-associated C-terminal domain-containing protein [Chitinophagales bacterium]